VVKEKQKAVNAALKEMIEFGFSAGGAGIQKIVEMFGEWVSGTDEVKSKTKDLREEEQRQAEKRKEFFIAQLPELNQRIYWINTEKEAFIKAGIDRVEAETWAQEEIDQIREEHHQKELERQKEGAQVLISAVSSMVSSITSIWNQAYQNQETALKNDYQRRKKAIEANITDEEQRTAALENLDREYDQKRAELQTKQAKADKAAALLQAIVNTAAAIVEALPNIPLAILVGALGAIQIGVIAAQPIPKFAAGVRDFVVPPGYPNDSYPIMVESGERVSVTSAAATGSSEMIRNTIILDGRVIADYVTEAIRDRQIVVDAGAVR
jgi:hypothetical protein